MLKTPQPIGSHGDSSEAFMNNPCSTWRHEIFIGSLCPWSLEQWVWGSRVPPPSLKGAGEGCPRPGPTSDPWRGAGSYGGTGTSVSAGKTNPPKRNLFPKHSWGPAFCSRRGCIHNVPPAQPCSRSLSCSRSPSCRLTLFGASPLGSQRSPLAGLAPLPFVS